MSWLRALVHRLLHDPEPYAPEFADPVDRHAAELAKALLTPDCPTIVAGSDIDASQWAGIVQQLPDLAEINAARLEAFYLIPEN